MAEEDTTPQPAEPTPDAPAATGDVGSLEPAEPYWAGDVGGQRVQLSKDDVTSLIHNYTEAVSAAQARLVGQQESSPQPQRGPAKVEDTGAIKEVMDHIKSIGDQVGTLSKRFDEADRQQKTQSVLQGYERDMLTHDFFRQMKEAPGGDDKFRKALRYALIEQSGDPNMSRETAINKTLEFLGGMADSANADFVKGKVQAAQRSTPPAGGAPPAPTQDKGPLTGKDFSEGKTEEWAMDRLTELLG